MISDEVVVTHLPDFDGGAMILAHPNGCVEILAVDSLAFPECAAAELNYYYSGGTLTHNACDLYCVTDAQHKIAHQAWLRLSGR